MTAFTTITDATLTANKPIKQSWVRALRDNPIAITEGSAGSPKIQTAALEQTASSEAVTTATIRAAAVTKAKIASAAIAQGQLDTATEQLTTQSTTGVHITMAGAGYSFWPKSGAVSPSAVSTVVASGYINSTYTAVIHHTCSDGTNFVGSSTRYIQASPPYDLGDGEVPLFVFFLLDASGRIIASSSAEDPVWAHNGPTNIVPDVWIAGRPYRIHGKRAIQSVARGDIETLRAMARSREHDADGLIEVRHRHAALVAEAAKLSDSAAKGFLSLDENERLVRCHEELALQQGEMERKAAAADVELIEVTHAVKNADMPLIPHPFMSNDLSGLTVVLLDPVGSVAEELFLRQRFGGDFMGDILSGGHLQLDNNALKRAGPPGVLTVGAKWKRTR